MHLCMSVCVCICIYKIFILSNDFQHECQNHSMGKEQSSKKCAKTTVYLRGKEYSWTKFACLYLRGLE